MIYLNEDCINHIMSFFKDYNMKYIPIEELFIAQTSKYLNFVVNKFSSIKQLSNKEHAHAVEQYYYSSMYNMQMIHELESLNMRSIPLHSFPSFLVRISENVVMLKYFYDKPFFGVHKDIRIKIRLNNKIVEFLFDFVTNPESLTFLHELRKFFILKMIEDDDNDDDYYDYDFQNMIISNILSKVMKREKGCYLYGVSEWANNNYEFKFD
jgi:hypothetical protein